MLKALEHGVKGNKWFSLIDKVYKLENLRSAYAQVRRNGGAAGIDHISVERFGRDLEQQLTHLRQELQDGRYQPKAARRVWIDKPGSTAKRPLGIPTVRDRVVEAALKNVLEPIFEREFRPCSHGFRPGRGCKSALREVDQRLKTDHLTVVEVDIQRYFENIDHEKLLALIAERVSDGRVLELIASMLKRGVIEEHDFQASKQGTPQGGVISPLLANIYLHGLDQELQQAGYHLVRYADDLVILCLQDGQARDVQDHLEGWMKDMGLQLHPEKTGVVDMRKPGAWFEFLGYRFMRGKRSGKLRRFISPKSRKKLKDRLRPHLKRCNGNSLGGIIEKLNPSLRGWYEYFKHAAVDDLKDIDGWVRMRLRSILRKRRGGEGRGRGQDHIRWKVNYFADHGLFSLEVAHGKELRP
jgi:RNA-directed DNA polymerase